MLCFIVWHDSSEYIFFSVLEFVKGKEFVIGSRETTCDVFVSNNEEL